MRKRCLFSSALLRIECRKESLRGLLLSYKAQRRPRGQMPGAPGNSPGVSSKKLIMCKICAELCACAVVVTLGAPLLLRISYCTETI